MYKIDITVILFAGLFEKYHATFWILPPSTQPSWPAASLTLHHAAQRCHSRLLRYTNAVTEYMFSVITYMIQ